MIYFIGLIFLIVILSILRSGYKELMRIEDELGELRMRQYEDHITKINREIDHIRFKDLKNGR